MDRDSNPLPPDARATRRALLLRRLAQMLDEMRLGGIDGPAAFDELVGRNPMPSEPTR
jgi:hypothetical protein